LPSIKISFFDKKDSFLSFSSDADELTAIMIAIRIYLILILIFLYEQIKENIMNAEPASVHLGRDELCGGELKVACCRIWAAVKPALECIGMFLAILGVCALIGAGISCVILAPLALLSFVAKGVVITGTLAGLIFAAHALAGAAIGAIFGIRIVIAGGCN
jgi:hypothetical protein